jgi:hypothetical protein
MAQLTENNAARRGALLGTPDPVNYWKQPRRSAADEKALRELRREESKLLREALGTDAESPDVTLRESAGLTILTADKAELVRRLARERDEKRSEASAANGYNYEESLALDREFRDALRRTLTPQEFFEFELRTSSRANLLREQLAGGEVTEEEFRAIYRLRTALDEQFEAGTAARDPAVLAARQKAEATLREQIRNQLGAERGAEFERMENYDYRRTTEVLARLGLPRATGAQISTLQTDILQRRGVLVRAYNAGTLSREAMLAQFRGLQQEATTKLTPLLRDTRGLEAYRKYAGTWIADIMPVR